MGELRQCPVCSLISSPEALRCDCGHRFRDDRLEGAGTFAHLFDDDYTPSLAPPSLLEIQFSLEGRIGRVHYWRHVLATLIAFFLVLGLIALVSEGSSIALVPTIVAFLVMSWIMLALKVKRLHDRDRPGWWLLLGNVPLVNMWLAIEIGLLAGTPGRNQYGPPPK